MANAADEAVGDSWEEMEDSGELDKRLQKIKTTSPVTIMTNPARVALVEEGNRSQYKPGVKILKRRPEDANNQISRGPVQAQPMKTLEQRQAEYAEARLRIFGSAESSTENPPADDKCMSPSEENKSERPARLVQQMGELKVNDAVVRQPKGPDGSKGFHTDR